MAGPGFSTSGVYTPLQVIAGAGLLDNKGIRPPLQLTSEINKYNNLNFVKAITAAIAAAKADGTITQQNLQLLETIASNSCPALGATVPQPFQNTSPHMPTSFPGGFGKLIENNVNKYLGSGQVDKFCQIFQSVDASRSQTNELIVSAINGTTYLGPTFTNMDDLITGYATVVSFALRCFGRDFARTGDLINLKNITDFGTPAAVLQQISTIGDIPRGTLSCIQEVLLSVGLTPEQIIALATPNTSTLNLTENEFNALQRLLYQGMQIIDGACLEYSLDILGVVTPGIENLADLLDLQKIFPNSWPSITTPTLGPERVPIFNTDGSVNPAVQQAIQDNTFIALPAGCDELAKIVPSSIAASNKAFQSSLQQIGNITNITPAELSAALLA